MRSRTNSSTALLLALLLLCGSTSAADWPACPGDLRPYPGSSGSTTLGEFLKRVAARDALDVGLAIRDSVDRDRPLELPLERLTCREALELVVGLEGLEVEVYRPQLWVVQSAKDQRKVRRIDGSILGPSAAPPPPRATGVPREGTRPPPTEDLPETVQIGVSLAGVSSRADLRSGTSSMTEDRTLQIATLSGSPASFSLGQVFSVQTPVTVLGPRGQVTVGGDVREVLVGLSLEVLPVVRGHLVDLEVNLLDEAPGRVTALGVDRSSRHLVTRVMVPRPGSTTIGGFGRAFREAGREGLLSRLTASGRSVDTLRVTLSVR